MASKGEKMKRLLEERRRLEAQIEGLKHELAGLNRAIALISGDAPPEVAVVVAHSSGKRRLGVKDMVLRLLSEHREIGLTANETVEAAARHGVDLDRGSVSSYLSRLKREGVVVLRDSKYRLAPKAGNSSAPEETPANLH